MAATFSVEAQRGGGSLQTLLIPAFLERRDVGGRKFEPFAVRALVFEALMPVGFDARGVVGSYRMNQCRLVGEGYAYFFDPPFEIVASADFVEVARLYQINRAFRCCRRPQIRS